MRFATMMTVRINIGFEIKKKEADYHSTENAGNRDGLQRVSRDQPYNYKF